MYEKNRTVFINKRKLCFEEIFNVFDVNNDNFIDLKEYLDAFKSFNHENRSLLVKNFEKISPQDKPVPVMKLVEDWVDFTSSNDPQNRDIVREEFEEGV